MSNGNLAKNTTFFTVAMAIQKILSFVYFIFVARFLGVADTGKFSFAMSFTTIFAIFLDFGLTQILIRECARDEKNSQKYLANVLALKLVGSAIIYGLVMLIINLMGYPEITRQMVYVSGFVMLIDSFALSFFGVLRGHQTLKFESISVIINQLIVLGVGLVVLWLHLGLVVLVGVYLLGSLFNFFYSFALLKIKFHIFPKINWDWGLIKKILKWSLPFAIAGIFIRIYSAMDVVLLSKLSTDAAVGIYSVAYKIAFALQFVALAFSATLYPAFSAYFVRSKEMLAQTFVRSMYFLMLLSVPIAIGLITIADKVIGPIFGTQYNDSVLPLQILMLALPFIFIYYPVGAILNACNRQTRNTVYLGITALVSFVLNLVLIPHFSYLGSAVTVLVSFALLFTMGFATVGKITQYDGKYLFIALIKILVAGLVMGAVELALKDQLHFILVIPLAAAVYFACLFLFKGLSKDDIKQVTKLVLRK